MRGKLLNIKKLLLAIFIVGSIFYAPHANGQAATMTTNITTVCAGSASPVIKFTYTGTGNEGVAPYTFTYKINNGSDLTVTTVSGDTVSVFVPTNNAGDYTYTLVSVAGSSAVAQVLSSEIPFKINSAPTVPVVTGTTTLCVGGTSRLSSDSLGGTWSSSDESIATVEPDGDVIAQSDGQVAIYYTITSSNGCASTRITTVMVYPIPTIEAIIGTAEVCIGSTTTFTTATRDGTWTWTSSTTNIATINSSGVITGVSAGTATITYNFTNSQTTCSASATKIVNVLVVPTVADIAGTFTVCKNLTTTLTNSTAGGTWSSNLINIATVDPNTGVVTGVSSGTATISYTVTDGGCSTRVSQAVIVSAPTVNPISVTASTLCLGGTITATSTTAGGTWTITNPSIATINSSGVVTGVSAGTTSIVYTVTSGGCSNSVTIGITVLAQPVPTFSFTSNPCSGASVGFIPSVTGTGPYTYSWNFGDGSPTSNLQNPSHTFISLGCGSATFTVTLTITDASGCSNSVENTITVKQQPTIDYEDTRNPFTQFDNCGLTVPSSSYQIRLAKVDGASSCITGYNINWGDGSTQETNVQLPLNYTYTTAGTFNLVVTAISLNGCNISKTIVVKNVGNPSGGIVNPGSTTNLCAPTAPIGLAISNWGTNAAGTIYEVNYGDGSVVTYTQEQMIQSAQYNSSSPASSSNYPIPHVYNITSCPSSSIPVTLTISNTCGSTIGSTTIGPILAKPVANFTAPLKTCVGSSVTYTNTTIAGFNQSCSRLTNYTWNFGDGSAEVTTGNIISPLNRSHTFTAAGTYSVTLTTTSYCGTTTKSKC